MGCCTLVLQQGLISRHLNDTQEPKGLGLSEKPSLIPRLDRDGPQGMDRLIIEKGYRLLGRQSGYEDHKVLRPPVSTSPSVV